MRGMTPHTVVYNHRIKSSQRHLRPDVSLESLILVRANPAAQTSRSPLNPPLLHHASTTTLTLTRYPSTAPFFFPSFCRFFTQPVPNSSAPISCILA